MITVRLVRYGTNRWTVWVPLKVRLGQIVQRGGESGRMTYQRAAALKRKLEKGEITLEAALKNLHPRYILGTGEGHDAQRSDATRIQ